jgi:hypothetical protein
VQQFIFARRLSIYAGVNLKNAVVKHPIETFLKNTLLRIATNCYRLSSASDIRKNKHQSSGGPLGLLEERI